MTKIIQNLTNSTRFFFQPRSASLDTRTLICHFSTENIFLCVKMWLYFQANINGRMIDKLHMPLNAVPS